MDKPIIPAIRDGVGEITSGIGSFGHWLETITLKDLVEAGFMVMVCSIIIWCISIVMNWLGRVQDRRAERKRQPVANALARFEPPARGPFPDED